MHQFVLQCCTFETQMHRSAFIIKVEVKDNYIMKTTNKNNSRQLGTHHFDAALIPA